MPPQTNVPKSRHDIEVEIDRYIVWPFQALSCKIGEIKIEELRAKAETEPGDAFDLRAFHDVVLDKGSLPLDTLAQRINAWIDREKAAGESESK